VGSAKEIRGSQIPYFLPGDRDTQLTDAVDHANIAFFATQAHILDAGLERGIIGIDEEPQKVEFSP
jgi:hypothetical protein